MDGNRVFVPFFNRPNVGWVYEEDNEWCRHWIRVPDSKDGRGFIEWEASKFLLIHAMMVTALTGGICLVAIVLLSILVGFDAMSWIQAALYLGAISGFLFLFLGIGYLLIASDWAYTRRMRKQQEAKSS